VAAGLASGLTGVPRQPGFVRLAEQAAGLVGNEHLAFVWIHLTLLEAEPIVLDLSRILEPRPGPTRSNAGLRVGQSGRTPGDAWAKARLSAG
jgi:hypothetical protein